MNNDNLPDKGVNNNEVAEWQLPSEYRLQMVKRIREILMKRFQVSDPVPMEKVHHIAEVFEDRVYQLSKSSAEYSERIRRKLQGTDKSNEPNVSQSNTSAASITPSPASITPSPASGSNFPLQVQNGTGATRGTQGSEASLYTRPSASGLPHVPFPKVVDQDSDLLNLSKNQTAGKQRVTEAPLQMEQQSRYLQQGSIQRQSQPQNGTGATRGAQGSEASLYARPSASGLPHSPLPKVVDQDSGLLNLSKNQTAGKQRVTEAPMQMEQQSRYLQQASIQRQSQPQNGTGVTRGTQGSEASLYARPSASGLPHVPLPKVVDQDSGLLNLSKNQTAGKQRVTEAPMQMEQQSRYLQQGSIQRQSQPQLLNLSKVEDNTRSSSSMPNIQIQHGRLQLVQNPPLMHSSPQSARQSSSSQGSQAESAKSSGFSAGQKSTQSKLMKLPQTVPRKQPRRPQQVRSSASAPEEASQPSAQERPLVSQSQSENMPSRLPNTGKINPASADTRAATSSSWQDMVYEKAQHLKKEYCVELIEIRQKIIAELKKQQSVPQNVNEGNNKERDRGLRKVVEAMSILSRNKDAIKPGYEDRLELLEKQVLFMRNSKRTISSQPQGQQLASKVGPFPESQLQNVSPVNTKTENLPSDVPSITQARSASVGNSKIPVSDVLKDETVKPSTPVVISTPGMTSSPLPATNKEPEKSKLSAIHRLVKAVKNISPNALVACSSAIQSVIENTDGIPLPPPISGSGVISGDMRAIFSTNGYDSIERRNLKRSISPVSFNDMSASGGLDDYPQQFTDIEPTAVFQLKGQRTEANHYLLEEIRKINQKLIDTNVQISEETWNRAQGTVVSCCYNATAVSPALKAKQPPLEPLRLLVPVNYPYGSPVLQDKLPTGFMTTHSREEHHVSANAKSKFQREFRVLEQPTSLTEIAKTWDICARAAMTEYAAQYGGGTFTSKYGAWEKKSCIRAD